MVTGNISEINSEERSDSLEKHLKNIPVKPWRDCKMNRLEFSGEISKQLVKRIPEYLDLNLKELPEKFQQGIISESLSGKLSWKGILKKYLKKSCLL